MQQCPPPQSSEMINEWKVGVGLGGRGEERESNVLLITRVALKMKQS